MGKRYSYRRSHQTDEARVKEGRGTGEGKDYSCWRRRQEENYNGTCLRRRDPELNRVVQLFGWMQIRCYYLLKSPEGRALFLEGKEARDIWENHPLLPKTETIEIADQLGFDHPRYSESNDYKMLLQDFLVTCADGSRIAIALLREDTLNQPWRKRQYEIQQSYWSKRNVTFRTIYEQELNILLSNNLRFLMRSNLLGPEAYPKESEEFLKKRYLTTTAPISELARETEAHYRLKPGLGLNIFWTLIRKGEITLQKLDQEPINLTADRTDHPPFVPEPAGDPVLCPVAGQVWQYTHGKQAGKLIRLLAIHENEKSGLPDVYYISMDPAALSIKHTPEASFLQLIDSGDVVPASVPDPLVEDPSPSMKAVQSAWLRDFRICSPAGRAIYSPVHRRAMFEAISTNRGISLRTVETWYARWLKSGFHPDSLYPDYPGRGSGKTETTKKNLVHSAIRDQLIRFLWNTYAVQNPPSLISTYNQFLILNDVAPEKAKELTKAPEASVPMDPEPGSLTYSQFRTIFYQWYRKNFREIMVRTFGEAEYALHHQEVLGRNDYSPLAPGSVYFIDSTTVDYDVIYPNRRAVSGRPTLTFIVDLFSRLITGYYLSFQKESGFTLRMALYNAMTDKRRWCRRYGINLKPGQWDIHYIPSCLTTDNGSAYKDYLSDSLCEELDIEIVNLKPKYAHLKAEIETKFHQINEHIGRIPGKVTKGSAVKHVRTARVTLDELNRIIIEFILAYNTSAVVDPQPSADLVGAELDPTPVAYWNWGIMNRGGLLRSLDPGQIHLGLLPSETGKISENGLIFHRLRYTNKTVQSELGWFVKARNHIPPNPQGPDPYHVHIRYDPTRVDLLYGYIPEKKAYLTFHLIGEYAHAFRGFSLEEVDLENQRKDARIKAQVKKRRDTILETIKKQNEIITGADSAFRRAQKEVRRLDTTHQRLWQKKEILRQITEDWRYIQNEQLSPSIHPTPAP